MARCRNKVMQYVPRGYHFKEVISFCGDTSIHGTELVCDDCLEEYEKQHPYGRDHCKHGTFIGDSCGPDYLCGYCESE